MSFQKRKKADVIYEDSDLLIVRKPSGVDAQSSRGFGMDMVSLLKKYVADEARKQGRPLRGEPYIAVIHRLDKPVCGVMVYAKTKEAAGALSEQFRDKTAGKVYYAIVQGCPKEIEGTLEDLLYFDRESNTSYVITEEDDPRRKDAKPAKLEYRVVEQDSDEAAQVTEALGWNAEPGQALVQVRLLTGRHHQIRVQMAHMGTPLVGDRRYGDSDSGETQLELCSWQLEIRHPKTGKPMQFCWDQK